MISEKILFVAGPTSGDYSQALKKAGFKVEVLYPRSYKNLGTELPDLVVQTITSEAALDLTKKITEQIVGSGRDIGLLVFSRRYEDQNKFRPFIEKTRELPKFDYVGTPVTNELVERVQALLS